jgi:hypothetical protein
MGRLSSPLIHAGPSASGLPDTFGVAALGFILVLMAVAWCLRGILKRLLVSSPLKLSALDLRKPGVRAAEAAAVLSPGSGQGVLGSQGVDLAGHIGTVADNRDAGPAAVQVRNSLMPRRNNPQERIHLYGYRDASCSIQLLEVIFLSLAFSKLTFRYVDIWEV